MKLQLLSLFALLAVSAPASAQVRQLDPEYLEGLYGPVMDVSLDSLAFSPETYKGRAVRVKGRLVIQGISDRNWELDDAGARVSLVPMRNGMNEEQLIEVNGHTIEVTGLFTAAPAGGGNTSSLPGVAGSIQFWRWLGPPEKVDKQNAAVISLEQLIAREGRMDGQLVRVVGKFRGRNLFADLPGRSLRSVDDWVIKDSLFAVWITNKKPKGDGFELDPSIRRDSDRWLEVIGRPTTKGGVVSIHAVEVALTQPPTPKAEAAPAPPPPPRTKTPPVIVFSLPLDGARDFDYSGRITVQFSNDMDEESFKGRVGLRYEGPPRPGDQGFPSMQIVYDLGAKALIVYPGAPIRLDRPLNLVLLTGIVDIDGQPLTRRDGKPPQNGIAEMLRFN